MPGAFILAGIRMSRCGARVTRWSSSSIGRARRWTPSRTRKRGADDVACRYAPIAQSVEQLPFKETVVGSNPTGRTWATGVDIPCQIRGWYTIRMNLFERAARRLAGAPQPVEKAVGEAANSNSEAERVRRELLERRQEIEKQIEMSGEPSTVEDRRMLAEIDARLGMFDKAA